jgi:hypothetical protein
MSIDELAGSFKFLGKAIIAANDETSKQAETFRQLGISITDSSGNLKPSIDLFKEIATALSKIPDGARKSTIEMELFGRSGVKLTEIMNLGGEAIQSRIDRGIELARVTEDDAEAANDLIRAQSELTQAWTGAKEKLGMELLPALTLVTSAITFFAEGSDEAVISAGGMVAMSNPVTAAWYSIAKSISVAADALNYYNTLEENQKNADASVKNAADRAQDKKIQDARALGRALGDAYNQPTESNPDTATQSMNPGGPWVAPTTVARPSTRGSRGSRASGPSPADDIKLESEPQYQRLLALQEFMDEQKVLEDEKTASAHEETLAKMQAFSDYELELFIQSNDAKLAEQKRFSDMYKAMGISVWQGGTDIMAQNLAKMVQGQKVGAKAMIKATGQMMGGIAAQMGSFYIAEGAAKVAESGWPPNPLALEAGWGEIYAGIGLKTLGSLLGGGGGGGGGGKGGKGGGGGKGAGRLASAPDQAALPATAPVAAGTATINIVGGDAATFTGKQVRDLVEKINEQTAKGMILRYQ